MLSINNNYVREIQLSYSDAVNDSLKVSNSSSAVEVFRKMWDKGLINIQEQFCVLFLNNSNEVNGYRCLNTGSLTSCTVDMKLLFGLACKSLSKAMVIAHNHPSGSLRPSESDIVLTDKIKKGCDLFGIRLLDHIILTDVAHYSFADHSKI